MRTVRYGKMAQLWSGWLAGFEYAHFNAIISMVFHSNNCHLKGNPDLNFETRQDETKRRRSSPLFVSSNLPSLSLISFRHRSATLPHRKRDKRVPRSLSTISDEFQTWASELRRPSLRFSCFALYQHHI